jgi:hypothetical protein
MCISFNVFALQGTLQSHIHWSTNWSLFIHFKTVEKIQIHIRVSRALPSVMELNCSEIRDGDFDLGFAV